jgi:hypothetical protein
MSLWTPGGEHPVDRGGDQGGPADAGPAPVGGDPGVQFTPEQEAEAQQIAAEMAAVREQLAQVPAAQVVANHAMGCWELAAIHLSSQPPNFAEAQVAIDSFAALVEVLQGKLGPDEATLNDALAQLRLAFVQMRASQGGDAPAPQGDAAPTAGTAEQTTEEPGDD